MYPTLVFQNVGSCDVGFGGGGLRSCTTGQLLSWYIESTSAFTKLRPERVEAGREQNERMINMHTRARARAM